MNKEKEKVVRRSYEVMGKVLTRGDSIELARRLYVSPQLITSWSREPRSRKDFSTGQNGPLDRIRTIINMIREDDGEPDRAYPLGEYIADLLGGVFVPVLFPTRSPASDMLVRISHVLKEIGDVIESGSKIGLEGMNKAEVKAECLKDIDNAIVALVQLKFNINSNHK